MKKAFICLILGLGLLLSACNAEGADTTAPESEAGITIEEITAPETEEPKMFKNPLSSGAAPDPFVLYHDGYYYATFTEALCIALYRSKSIETILSDEKSIIFNLSDEVQGNIWAPELHYNPAADRWYVYASGSTSGWDFLSIRMFCLESVTNDPFGEYVFKGFTDNDTFAIDQTVFYDEVSGMLYTAFSEFTSDGQVITFAVMDNPWTVSSRRIRLSQPDFSWEKKGAKEGKDERVNEGPVFLLNEGKLCLIYSASGCWSQYYCLGMIEFRGADFSESSLMNKENWKKHTDPVFSKANGTYGVGHCSFFKSPDGSETWIAYHGMATPSAGEEGRFMYAQKISFDESGIPVLGKPISRNEAIVVPSGE